MSKSCDSSGRVVWVDDKGNEHSEEEGMLGLTARQDPGQPGITKSVTFQCNSLSSSLCGRVMKRHYSNSQRRRLSRGQYALATREATTPTTSRRMDVK